MGGWDSPEVHTQFTSKERKGREGPGPREKGGEFFISFFERGRS